MAIEHRGDEVLALGVQVEEDRGDMGGDQCHDHPLIPLVKTGRPIAGATGNQLWLERFDGPAHNHDIATGIAVDAAGNVYVTGSSTTPSGGTEIVTLKYE